LIPSGLALGRLRRRLAKGGFRDIPPGVLEGFRSLRRVDAHLVAGFGLLDFQRALRSLVGLFQPFLPHFVAFDVAPTVFNNRLMEFLLALLGLVVFNPMADELLDPLGDPAQKGNVVFL